MGALLLVVAAVVWLLPVIIAGRDDPELKAGRRFSETGCLYGISIFTCILLGRILPIPVALIVAPLLHYTIFFALSDSFRNWVLIKIGLKGK